jgi:hypothetical protein
VSVHLNFHIHVDRNGKATVTSQTISGGTVPTTQLQAGDKVTFTSNVPSSEIRFKVYRSAPPPKTQEGSPFGDALPAGKRHTVADGKVFMVKKACDTDHRFTFDCGHDVNGDFSEWGARTGVTPGGNVPGPDE